MFPPPQRASASHFVYVFTIIINIICEWHAEARHARRGGDRGWGWGGGLIELKNEKKCWDIPFISKI